ncbi:hypothetical protein [Hyphococcus sp.]|uniref:hypothetical protein n=1 Tax=Hyphococcus sp. TaxID=2038636 RepID=UPI003CCBEF20
MRFPYLRATALALCSLNGAASAQPVAQNAEAWRADLAAMTNFIEETHPAPFAFTDETEWREGVEQLNERIPSMSDADIILGLAETVDALNDGHTRLTLPYAAPALVNARGHSSDAPLAAKYLFAQLPVGFAALSDSLVIATAAPEHEGLLGAQVDAIGGKDWRSLLKTAERYAYGENEGADRMFAAARLSLLPVLRAGGVEIEDAAGAVALSLTMPDGSNLTQRVELIKEASDVEPMAFADTLAKPPLRMKNPGDRQWYETVGRKAVYLHVDEIAFDPADPMIDDVEGAVEAAEKADVPLILDLRDNGGGNGFHNRTLVTGLLRSDHLTDFGNLRVLIGPRTFSAAQFVVNELERFAQPIFIGLPTGAHPSHYGDSRKLALPNSGMTLRVSSMAWSNWNGWYDPRSATAPHYRAEATREDFLEGRDAALEKALSLPANIGILDLLEHQLREERGYESFIIIFNANTASGKSRPSVEDFLALGETFESEGRDDLAGFLYRRAAAFHPDHGALAAAVARTEPPAEE